MSRLYRYLGPADLLESMGTPRFRVASASDVLRWIREIKPLKDADGAVTATFILDADGFLWIADRHSEHVSCALGQPVLAAGEISFFAAASAVSLVRVTNQSTGYCPEPSSWPAVAAALEAAGLSPPDNYTQVFVFRFCTNCQTKNVVKDEHFACGVCGAELDENWNLDAVAGAKTDTL